MHLDGHRDFRNINNRKEDILHCMNECRQFVCLSVDIMILSFDADDDDAQSG